MKKCIFKLMTVLLAIVVVLSLLSTATVFATNTSDIVESGLFFDDFEDGSSVIHDETHSGVFGSWWPEQKKVPTISTINSEEIVNDKNVNTYTGLLSNSGKVFNGTSFTSYSSIFSKSNWAVDSESEAVNEPASGLQNFSPDVWSTASENNLSLKSITFDTIFNYSSSCRGFIVYRWNNSTDYSAFVIFRHHNYANEYIINFYKAPGETPVTTDLAVLGSDDLDNKVSRFVLNYGDDGTVSLDYYNPDSGISGTVIGKEKVDSSTAYFGVMSSQNASFYMDNLGVAFSDSANATLFRQQYSDLLGYANDPASLPDDTSNIEKMLSVANWNYGVLPESSKQLLSDEYNALKSLNINLIYKNKFVNNSYTLDFENDEILMHDKERSGVQTVNAGTTFINKNEDNPYSDAYNSSAKISHFGTKQQNEQAFKYGQLQFLTPDVWNVADYKNLTLTSANLDMVINTGVSYQHIIIYKYKDKENFAFWSLSVGKGTDGTDMSLGIRNYEVTSEILAKIAAGDITQIPSKQFLNSQQDNDSKGFSKTAWSKVGIVYEDDGNVKLTVKRIDGAEFTFDSEYDLDSVNERYFALSDTSYADSYVDNISLNFAEKSEYYKPQAVSATIRANSYANGNTQGLRFKYRLPYEVPESSTLVEYGAVATAYKVGMDITAITVGAENTVTAKNTAPASDCLGKEFYATVTGITAENTTTCYIARSYVVYEDASGIRTTVYSDNTTENGDYAKRTGCVDGCIVRSVASIAKAMVKAVYAQKDNLTINGDIDEIYDGSKFLSAATAGNGAGIINFIVANKAAIEAVSRQCKVKMKR